MDRGLGRRKAAGETATEPPGTDFFARIRCPGALRVNEAGDLLFAVEKPNLDKNRYDRAFWLYRQSRLRRLRLPGDVAGHWWRDSETLLLACRGGRGGKTLARKGLPLTVFKTMGMQPGAKPKTLFTLYAEAEWAFPLPGGEVLVLARWDSEVDAALAEEGGSPEKAAALLERRRACSVLGELPFWENGGGITSGKRRRLYLWAGGAPRPLTETGLDVEDAALSPDGKTAYLFARTYQNGVASVTHRLYAADLAAGALREITFAPLRLDACLPLEDGRLLVAGSDMRAHGLNQNPAFYLREPGGAAKLLNDSGRYGVYPSVNTDAGRPSPSRWWAKGRHAYFLSTWGDSSHLMCLDTDTGEIAPVTKEPGAVSEAAPTGDGCFAVAMRGLCGPEVLSIGEDGTETQITRFNSGSAVSNIKLTPMTPLTVSTKEGAVHGWVMLPENGGKKIPGLLYIHGGPKTVYGSVLFCEMQYWAAQGCAVMLCNPRGSDGRGDGFADIRGHYGGPDSRDLLAFLDEALKKYPVIDPERVAAAGGSYGGFMVNWLIGHTTRFAAAVSERGIASWTTMALLSDIGYYFVPDQAACGDLRAACGEAERSPLAGAESVSTPTLFVHSDEDYRCPLPEGLQMYAALKLRGVPARMVVFHGENHELSRGGRPQNRLRRLEEMRAWLARYLKL